MSEMRGPLNSCTAAGGTASFSITGDRPTLSDEKAAWPSVDFAQVVGHLYRIDGSCPALGVPMRVTRCGRCSNRDVIAVEVGTVGKTFAETPAHLWIVRQYYDLTSKHDEPLAVSIVAMVLARYDRSAERQPSIWVRDGIRHALDTYRTAERASTMIRRYGRDDLIASVPPLVQIAATHGDEPGLVREFPYIPVNPRSAPFVGAWGMFASAVFLERSDGTLAKAWELRDADALPSRPAVTSAGTTRR